MKKLIKCRQVFEFSQEVELTEEELNQLENAPDHISFDHHPEAYSILECKIDPTEVLAADMEYLDVDILDSEE